MPDYSLVHTPWLGDFYTVDSINMKTLIHFPLKNLQWEKKKKRTYSGDFPGGPVVKNPPFNAGNLGWIPGLGTKIPHALGQLSL